MRVIVLILALTICGCRDREPAAPTAEQSAQLNEAEGMLNSLSSNEEGPEQRPGPSNSSD